MPLGSRRREEPLHVFLMALALIAAAFTGAMLGKIWHSAMGSDEGEPAEQASETSSDQGDQEDQGDA